MRRRRSIIAMILAAFTLGSFSAFAAPPISDAAITAQVREGLMQDPVTRVEPIQVETKNGTVVFTGKVRDRSLLNRASRAAWSVVGVNAVQNRLNVEAM